jgi:hypothetical protein
VRDTTTKAAAPRTSQTSWRWKKNHAEPVLVMATTELAESTITTPMTFSTATVATSSQYVPDFGGRGGRGGFGGRPAGWAGRGTVATTRPLPTGTRPVGRSAP